MAIKHIVSKLACLWHGHAPIPGTFYSWVYGRRVTGTICRRCHKVL